ncbi:MAG: hypothetical protein EOL87_14550 [Spartobacteria bacterium]|nr:hypothetical protein [Spartobacteria bacterium]
MTAEAYCPQCKEVRLILRKSRYDGFTKIGEDQVCSSCGCCFPEEKRSDKDAQSATEGKSDAFRALFSEDELPERPHVFNDDEQRHFCRYCVHYIVNPFKQWCGLNNKDVAATDSCEHFDPKI